MTVPIERLSPEMRQVLERLVVEDGQQPDPTTLSSTEARSLLEASNRRWNTGQPQMASVRDVSKLAGLNATAYMPKNDDGRHAILYVHGGGWSFCSSATHDGASRQLAEATGTTVVTFDYRLAPEHPYPVGLQDCLSIWAARNDLCPNRTWSISGDSAGANLAIALMLRLIEAGKTEDLPVAGLLFYGVFDADFESSSYREIADGPGLTRDKMRRYWDFYAPSSDRHSDPCLSPARASDALLSGLPPLYLNAAEIDPLRSDSEALHGRLAALGRHDQLEIVPGVIHGFMQMSLWLPQSAAAYRRAGEAFRQMTGCAATRPLLADPLEQNGNLGSVRSNFD
ncbi:MAG: alpha/beta hydrolase [Mesorhizobium sp.]|nr:alpha/beta hydrolase [Mesorhizobium sp.]MBL8580378.1 alpha/beta hydrolase [Mesorhizobium sp.]